MPIFVLDCSATMAYFFKDETSTYVDSAFETLAEYGEAEVPPIWPLEVVNTCLNAERRNRMTASDVKTIFSILETLPIKIVSYVGLKSTWQIHPTAREHNLSAYDAAYLELAKQQNLPLVTLDKRLEQSAVRTGISLWTPFED